ncbi:MAG: hypothetical protein HY052_01180, partial [Proteobacteria bacterium]|nr:hypothetical protein [Pseudomonadota bacterium]
MRRTLLTRWLAVLAAVVLCLTAQSVEALMIPPDPFDATDRYALLILSPDGQAITMVMVKVKSPTPAPLGPGQLGARIRYQVPGPPAKHAIPPSYEVVSKPRPIDGLGGEAVLVSFDFSIQPLPADAQHRVLEIFYVASEPSALPEPVVELAPERLLLRPGGDVVEQTLSPSEAALAGRILAGPVILL